MMMEAWDPEDDGQVFFNVIKSIPANGICSPFNFHSYRSVNLFVTCRCVVCDVSGFPWNDMTYCIKCYKYCHRVCMRSRKVICDGHQGITSSSGSIVDKKLNQSSKTSPTDDSFLKYSLLYDSNFWSSRFEEVLTNARKGKTYLQFDIPFSMSTTYDQTKVLSKEFRQSKSLLRHLCHTMHKIFLLATQSIDNHVLILESGRKCLDTIGRFVVSALPDSLRYDNDALLSIYNAIDTYMLTWNDSKMYLRLLNSACVLGQTSEMNLRQHLPTFISDCAEDINCTTTADRILHDADFLHTAVTEVNKIRSCKSGMDKLAQIIHVLQFLSTQRLVNPEQQHLTMTNIVASPPVSAASSPVKLNQLPSAIENVVLTVSDPADCGDDSDDTVTKGLIENAHGVSMAEAVPLLDTNNDVDIQNSVNLTAEGLSASEEQAVITHQLSVSAISSTGTPSTSLGDVFSNALKWLPAPYQDMIQSRLRQFHDLYFSGKERAAEGSSPVGDDGQLVPVGTELLILRLRFALLEALRRSQSEGADTSSASVSRTAGVIDTTLSSSNTSAVGVCWSAEVVYLSALAPEGEWLLGPSGYALATLSTALQLQPPVPPLQEKPVSPPSLA